MQKQIPAAKKQEEAAAGPRLGTEPPAVAALEQALERGELCQGVDCLRSLDVLSVDHQDDTLFDTQADMAQVIDAQRRICRLSENE